MFSIIIPCHNYGKFLLKCLKSIEFENDYLKEVIILNDSSEDNTDEIIENFVNKKKIVYYKVKFKSLAKTINFGAKKVTTKYFSRIDPDDEYHPMFFEKIVNRMINKEYHFIYGDVIQNKNSKTKYLKQKINLYNQYIKHPLSNGTLIDSKNFIKIGGISENIKFKDDYDFWLKIVKAKSVIKYVNVPTFFYNKHDKNMSNNKLKRKYTAIQVFLKNKL